MADDNDKLSLHIASKNVTTMNSGFVDVSATSGFPLLSIGGSGNGGSGGGTRVTSTVRRDGSHDVWIGSGTPNVPESDQVWVWNA